MRLAYLNMTEPGASCPTSLRQINTPAKLCGRHTAPGCSSVTYPVDGIRYSKVCGQARGYQYYSTDGFKQEGNDITDINSHYMWMAFPLHMGAFVTIFGRMPLDNLMITIMVNIDVAMLMVSLTIHVPSTLVRLPLTLLDLIISVNLE